MGGRNGLKKEKKKLNPAVIVAVRGPGRTTAQTKKKAAKKFPKRLNRNRKSRKMWYNFWVALPKYTNTLR